MEVISWQRGDTQDRQFAVGNRTTSAPFAVPSRARLGCPDGSQSQEASPTRPSSRTPPSPTRRRHTSLFSTAHVTRAAHVVLVPQPPQKLVGLLTEGHLVGQSTLHHNQRRVHSPRLSAEAATRRFNPTWTPNSSPCLFGRTDTCRRKPLRSALPTRVPTETQGISSMRGHDPTAGSPTPRIVRKTLSSRTRP